MRSSLLHLLRGSSLAAAPLLMGCATSPVPEQAAPPVITLATLRAAQRGHGLMAAFELCEAVTCPQPTPKTFGPTDQTRGDTRHRRIETFVDPEPERPP